ncbi:hypothetical protein ACFWFF_09625 [Streptomyces sp. NPDC060223]
MTKLARIGVIAAGIAIVIAGAGTAVASDGDTATPSIVAGAYKK